MASHVLTRVHSLRDHIDGTLSSRRNELSLLLSKIERHGKGILKPHQIEAEYEALPKHAQHKLHDETFWRGSEICQELNLTTVSFGKRLFSSILVIFMTFL